MAYKLGNRVKVSVSGTPGTGSITLGSALTGFVSFATAGVANTDTLPYVIEDGAAWEIGVGTYSSTGPTLARTTITASSNSNSAISATANAIVMLSPLAADLQSTDTLTSGTLPVARGGTGLTTLDAGRIPFGAGTSAFGNNANLFWDGSRLLLGSTTAQAGGAGLIPNLQLHGTTNGTSTYGVFGWGSAVTPFNQYNKSNSATIGTYSIVSNGAFLGEIGFAGDDGTAFARAASIRAIVASAPAAGSMPGALVFNTTPSGSTTPTERLRIDSVGNIGVGTTTVSGITFGVAKTITGAAAAAGIYSYGVVQSDVSTDGMGFYSRIGTVDAAFTLTNLHHYRAFQGTFGASSTVTNQYGFHAHSNLTGATNNFGFYSNIASGTGRWNFYANGTANNYFAGNVGIGTTAPDRQLHVYNSAADAVMLIAAGTGLSGYIAVNGDNRSNLTGAFTFNQFNTGVAQINNRSNADLYFGTNNTERLRIDSSGNVGIGTSSPNGKLEVNGRLRLSGSESNQLEWLLGAQTWRLNVSSSNSNFYLHDTTNNKFPFKIVPNTPNGTLATYAAGGFGYDIGSGGAVTQATSRTTGVTLNTACGAITLVSAAGSTSWQSFTVTNSAVATTDAIIVNQDTGTDLYQIFVTNVAAGSFRITFATTGGTTTEQPIFNFAVIKAVAA